MQENWQQLISAFEPPQSYVLATIVATRGSTYRKTGTFMLISSDGVCTGLLSGGCLEADISLHAMSVFNSSQTKLLTYDLKADAELLWGLGLGCDGALDIFLQPLNSSNHYLAFDSMIDCLNKRNQSFYCQLINDQTIPYSFFIEEQTSDLALIEEKLRKHLAYSENIGEFLVTPVQPPISILICGAGPDVLPVVAMSNQLGWQVSLWDHRPAYLNKTEFGACFSKKKVRAEEVQNGDMQGYDGVVIMSHNLTSDGLFLQQALADNLEYIGLLGPAGRRDKLLDNLSLTAADVENQVFGPVGLNLGGRSPQAIALSICAEIQQQMSYRYLTSTLKPFVFKHS